MKPVIDCKLVAMLVQNVVAEGVVENELNLQFCDFRLVIQRFFTLEYMFGDEAKVDPTVIFECGSLE